MGKARRSDTGFTLIELLIVLGILALMAGIAVPIFAQGQRKARTTTCAASLRQIGQALALYISDNDGAYPAPIAAVFRRRRTSSNLTWCSALKPYTGEKTFPTCPDRDLRKWKDRDPTTPFFAGYAYNGMLTRYEKEKEKGSGSYVGEAETILQHPALTVAVLDARLGVLALMQPDYGDLNGYSIVLGQSEAKIEAQIPGSKRHQDGANYLFCDGHVKWYRREAILWEDSGKGTQPSFVP